MKHPCSIGPRHRAASLIEAVIAVAVLAVAIPMVLGALCEAGKCALAAQAETRSAWIVPACLNEIRASREGRPGCFPATTTGQAFPPPGEVWALAFSAQGHPVGKLPGALYHTGTQQLHATSVRYIASLDCSGAPDQPFVAPMMNVRITLEYPASSPATQRRKLDFHTRTP